MNGNGNGNGVPAALANSMGREKKPFSYLPGGIDFSELKSPRMQKRINKHLQGSGQSADQTVGVLLRIQAILLIGRSHITSKLT